MVRLGRRQTGAVLAIVLVLSLVLVILSSAVYILFRSNTASHVFISDRIRAQTAAESGVHIALYDLALEDSAPQSREPFSMEGDSAQWVELPGSGGKVWIVIDPYNQNNPDAIGGVEIRCRGLSGNITRDICVRAAPDYPSRYALLVAGGIGRGFFCDGRQIDGPVHANGVIEFESISADSSGDPRVYSVSTSRDGGFRFAGYGLSEDPHPEGSSVWVQPYLSHVQGKPSWDPHGHTVDFHSLADHFRWLVSTAHSEGVILTGVERILLDGNMLYSKANYMAPPDTVNLSDVRLVYIQNGSKPVYMKSISTLECPLTIVSGGSIYIAGHIDGSAASSGGPLAVVSLRDIVIASDPDCTGEVDWSRPWQIETDRTLLARAVLAAPSGTLRAEDPTNPEEVERLTVIGGVIVNSMVGNLGYAGKGHELIISWDSGLGSIHPPFFPALDYWEMSTWAIDPDYGNNREIDDDLF